MTRTITITLEWYIASKRIQWLVLLGFFYPLRYTRQKKRGTKLQLVIVNKREKVSSKFLTEEELIQITENTLYFSITRLEIYKPRPSLHYNIQLYCY